MAIVSLRNQRRLEEEAERHTCLHQPTPVACRQWTRVLDVMSKEVYEWSSGFCVQGRASPRKTQRTQPCLPKEQGQYGFHHGMSSRVWVQHSRLMVRVSNSPEGSKLTNGWASAVSSERQETSPEHRPKLPNFKIPHLPPNFTLGAYRAVMWNFGH